MFINFIYQIMLLKCKISISVSPIERNVFNQANFFLYSSEETGSFVEHAVNDTKLMKNNKQFYKFGITLFRSQNWSNKSRDTKWCYAS